MTRLISDVGHRERGPGRELALGREVPLLRILSPEMNQRGGNRRRIAGYQRQSKGTRLARLRVCRSDGLSLEEVCKGACRRGWRTVVEHIDVVYKRYRDHGVVEQV